MEREPLLYSGANFILEMTKEDFHTRIIKKVAKSNEFARLVCFGLDALSEADKKQLIKTLRDSGVRERITENDLLSIAYAITTRASSYK